MDIEWFGHSCFRLRGAQGVVVTDPYGPVDAGQENVLRAEIVTVSHAHPGHDRVGSVAGQPFVIDGPGDYEVQGIFVTGLRMSHDAHGGNARGFTTAYCVLLDDLNLCHLGDLGHRPSQEHVEAIGSVDILLVPVGGGNSLGPSQAAEVVRLLDPAIVIPMHGRSRARPDLEPVSRFLKEMGIDEAGTVSSLSITRAQLPEEPEVVVLTPRWLSAAWDDGAADDLRGEH